MSGYDDIRFADSDGYIKIAPNSITSIERQRTGGMEKLTFTMVLVPEVAQRLIQAWGKAPR